MKEGACAKDGADGGKHGERRGREKAKEPRQEHGRPFYTALEDRVEEQLCSMWHGAIRTGRRPHDVIGSGSKTWRAISLQVWSRTSGLCDVSTMIYVI